MRCHICDRLLNEPRIDPDIGEFDPCEVCMAVVEDTLQGFTDAPSAQEDAPLGIDPIWDEIFPPMYDSFEEMS